MSRSKEEKNKKIYQKRTYKQIKKSKNVLPSKLVKKYTLSKNDLIKKISLNILIDNFNN